MSACAARTFGDQNPKSNDSSKTNAMIQDRIDPPSEIVVITTEQPFRVPRILPMNSDDTIPGWSLELPLPDDRAALAQALDEVLTIPGNVVSSSVQQVASRVLQDILVRKHFGRPIARKHRFVFTSTESQSPQTEGRAEFALKSESVGATDSPYTTSTFDIAEAKGSVLATIAYEHMQSERTRTLLRRTSAPYVFLALPRSWAVRNQGPIKATDWTEYAKLLSPSARAQTIFLNDDGSTEAVVSVWTVIPDSGAADERSSLSGGTSNAVFEKVRCLKKTINASVPYRTVPTIFDEASKTLRCN
jgi:hypothetical protein